VKAEAEQPITAPVNQTAGLRQAGNVALALCFCGEAGRVILFAEEVEFVTAGSVLAAAMAAWFVLWRPAPIARDTGWGALVAILAAASPFVFYQLIPDYEKAPPLTAGVQICALLLMIASIVTLRASFSVIPEYRTLIRKGPYRLVRHPLYAAYLLFDGAMAYQAQSLLAILLWLAEYALFHARAIFEERLLLRTDARYAFYRQRVRYLFVPFLI
jgi:protein-S-isoprenylcysteine O-methyltransferase Ste14